MSLEKESLEESLEKTALSRTEYELIVKLLGREPKPVELGMFGAMWSEHCGYKHSKSLLKLLPSSSPRLLVAPGEENAGVVDIGDDIAVAFKIESHNHPSAIEPFQGAATGVGGIVRDILAMGAQPIALLNSLRFGPLTDPQNKYLFQGVVAGISSYGNCLGIPDVGGEIHFSPTYSNNPLVNAMCVGLIRHGQLVRSAAKTPGNTLMLVGAQTGRDGIHGASGLASRAFEEERELRTTVQVGNPFLEKVLIEACLEAATSPFVEALQDLGAAGLTSSAIECADRGGTGIIIDVAKVPRREKGMNPYEIMLSESQERMLIVINQGHEADVQSIFEKWDVQWAVIGKVTNDGLAHIYEGENLVAELAIEVLANPPQYRPVAKKPKWLDDLNAFPLESVPIPSQSAGGILLQLLKSPNIASKESVYRQYDHQVQTNTVVPPGSDAAVLRIKGTAKGIALATDGNGRQCYLDPQVGGAMAVAEACRNLVCTGATPIALTDCLNFGNPEKPEVYFQLERCILGMVEACQTLGIPIVSGNVSLYNETKGEAIYPTPVVGALGLLEDISKRCTQSFEGDGDLVVLLGASKLVGHVEALAGSEYLELIHGLVAGRPSINLEFEAGVQRLCQALIKDGVINASHDCSEGGLAVALAEGCISGGQGFNSDFAVKGRWDALLFGETASQIIVTLPKGQLSHLAQLAKSEGVPWMKLGVLGGTGFHIEGWIDLPLVDMAKAWRTGLDNALHH